ncbi:MAG: c-type cytochrome [Gemmatimonadota bacterium]|nr:c-type cytochrome [Gemmatimonadota bacterium]
MRPSRPHAGEPDPGRSRVNRWSRAALALLAATLGCAGAGPDVETDPELADEPAATPAAAASFTAAQAERGREEFGYVCAECHATSEFRGRDFQFRWRRRTAWDFFRNVTETMPEDAPGSLTDGQYVDIIAFILEMNGFPPGEVELEATESALDRFIMDGAPPDGR